MSWAQKVGYPTNKPVRIPHKKIEAAVEELSQEVYARSLNSEGKRTLPERGIPYAYLAGLYYATHRDALPSIRRREYAKLAEFIKRELAAPLMRPGWYYTSALQEFPTPYYVHERARRQMLVRISTLLMRYIPSLNLDPMDYVAGPLPAPERCGPDTVEYPQLKRLAHKLAQRSGKKRYIAGQTVSATPPKEHNGYVIAKPNGDFVYIRPSWQYPNDKNRVHYVERAAERHAWFTRNK